MPGSCIRFLDSVLRQYRLISAIANDNPERGHKTLLRLKSFLCGVFRHAKVEGYWTTKTRCATCPPEDRQALQVPRRSLHRESNHDAYLEYLPVQRLTQLGAPFDHIAVDPVCHATKHRPSTDHVGDQFVFDWGCAEDHSNHSAALGYRNHASSYVETSDVEFSEALDKLAGLMG